MRVLIINHPHIECGLFQFGKRTYEIASKSTKIDYFYKIISNHTEYIIAIDGIKPDYVLYNYHWDRMPWLVPNDIKNNKNIKHYFYYHDGSLITEYDKYIFFGEFDPGAKAVLKEKRELLPRPLFEYSGSYPKNKIITIGSFGFCSTYKRFPQLVKLVNNTFSKAVINLHITRPWFGDIPGYILKPVVDACVSNNTNPAIKLNISTDFTDDTGLLTFLAKNDINILYYEETNNLGLSAAPDYLLSVKRPVAVTNVSLLRHIANKDNTLENSTIQEILDRGIEPLEQYYKKWSVENFSFEMDKLFMEEK